MKKAGLTDNTGQQGINLGMSMKKHPSIMVVGGMPLAN